MTLTPNLLLYFVIITGISLACVMNFVECKKFVQPSRHRKATIEQLHQNDQNMRTPSPSMIQNDQDLRTPVSHPSTVGDEFIIKNDEKLRTLVPTTSLPPSISPSVSKNLSKSNII